MRGAGGGWFAVGHFQGIVWHLWARHQTPKELPEMPLAQWPHVQVLFICSWIQMCVKSEILEACFFSFYKPTGPNQLPSAERQLVPWTSRQVTLDKLPARHRADKQRQTTIHTSWKQFRVTSLPPYPPHVFGLWEEESRQTRWDETPCKNESDQDGTRTQDLLVVRP